MHLQRIQVPDFRVLKDVDITFEKEFVPSIFPLGSLNGGGKSTLLQLIFVLLHCSVNPDRKMFLQNMLNNFKSYKTSDHRVLAIFNILNKGKNVQIQFFSHKDSHINEVLIKKGITEIIDDKNITFSSRVKLEENQNRIKFITKKITELEKTINQLDIIKKNESDEERSLRFRREITKLREMGVTLPRIISSRNLSAIEEYQKAIQEEWEVSKIQLKKLDKKHRELELASQEVLEYLESENLIYICNYSVNPNESEDEVLLCHINNLDRVEAESFLKELSEKVFLAAPSTQIFLFLSEKARKLLFRKQSEEENGYYSNLKEAKSKLSGLFTYDFIDVDLLIESFKAARDRDFRKAIETGGEYGNSYKELIKYLNLILVNKKINPNIELSGVNFQLDRDDENIELQPEDLSHGELKRLSIYLWLKYRNIENAIVLMDEIEIAFHPDWQYQIISDLQDWAPSNQYILATHSYELCQALTPSHVKELEPKLLKKQET